MICASNASPRESDITFGSHSPRATNLPRAPSTIIPHPINTPHFTDNTPRATDTFNDKKSRESIKASYQNLTKKKRRPIKHTRKKIGKQCPRDREWTNTKKETGVKADTEDPKKKDTNVAHLIHVLQNDILIIVHHLPQLQHHHCHLPHGGQGRQKSINLKIRERRLRKGQNRFYVK